MIGGESFPGRLPSLLLGLRDPNDAKAWNAFVQTYGPLVYRQCRRERLQDADAWDVTQEVLSQVVRCLRAFVYDPRRGRFRNWLRAVTRSKIARFIRIRARRTSGGGQVHPGWLDELPSRPAESQTTAECNIRLLRAALARARARFEPATWNAFERVWLADVPASQVALELDIPVDAVYVAKSRVLKQLRRETLRLAEDLPRFVPLT
jgi:RNA polymerase sigma-70 factor (ECF subfamily)